MYPYDLLGCWFEKMWKIFKNSHHVDCKILAFEVTKNPFFGPAKEQAAALHKVTFVCKNIQNGSVCLDSFFKKFGCMLEKFQISCNCTTYRKEIVS